MWHCLSLPKSPPPHEEEGSPWFPRSCLPPCSEYGESWVARRISEPCGALAVPPPPRTPYLWAHLWALLAGKGEPGCYSVEEKVLTTAHKWGKRAQAASLFLSLLRGTAASPAFLLFQSVAKAESSPSLPPFHPRPFLLVPRPPDPPNLGVSSRPPSLGGWDSLCPTPSPKGWWPFAGLPSPPPYSPPPSLNWEWP